jgi:hypothetical protein
VHAEPLEQFAAARGERLAVDAAAAGERLAAHEDVLRDREVGEERGLLVDHRDAGRAGGGRAVERHRLAVEQHAAGVGAVHTGEDLDQRRLARAVLADQGVRLAGAELEVRATQGGDRTEVLADVLEREHDAAVGRGVLRLCHRVTALL